MAVAIYRGWNSYPELRHFTVGCSLPSTALPQEMFPVCFQLQELLQLQGASAVKRLKRGNSAFSELQNDDSLAQDLLK